MHEDSVMCVAPPGAAAIHPVGGGRSRRQQVARALRLAVLGAAVALPLDAITPGHHLPEGPPRPVRERTVDVQRLTAELRFDTERRAAQTGGAAAGALSERVFVESGLRG